MFPVRTTGDTLGLLARIQADNALQEYWTNVGLCLPTLSTGERSRSIAASGRKRSVVAHALLPGRTRALRLTRPTEGDVTKSCECRYQSGAVWSPEGVRLAERIGLTAESLVKQRVTAYARMVTNSGLDRLAEGRLESGP